MKAIFRYCLWLSALASCTAAAQPITTEMDATRQAAEIDTTTTTQDIAFENDRYDRMTVPVLVSGSGPYKFIVDTGADRTAVSTAMADELGLLPGRNATLHSVVGVSSVRTAAVPRLQLTDERVRSFDAALLEARYMGADGILGVDSLRSERVVFDFRKRLISIVPSAQPIYDDEKGTIVVRGKLKRGHLIVTRAKVEDQPSVIVLDTGSEVSVGNQALRRKLERRGLLGTPQLVQMISVTGQRLSGEAFQVKQMEIGGVRIQNLSIVFADAHIFRTLSLEKKPTVLLGMDAMQAFDKVSIDFARKKLRVLMPEQGMIRQPVMAAR